MKFLYEIHFSTFLHSTNILFIEIQKKVFEWSEMNASAAERIW